MNKYKAITFILLATIAVSSLVALFLFPYKVLFSVLLVISILGLIAYYIFSGNLKTYHEIGREKYSDILIVEELERFFRKEKPYLNPNFRISDLEKQLKVSRSAISLFTKKRFKRNFNQFLNLWRIAELQRLQSLPENIDISINKLCLKAGFSNALQYHQAEKERKAINKKKDIKNNVIKKHDDDIVIDLCTKKKPEIQMRV